MHVLLGTDHAVESYKLDVDAALSREELLSRAVTAGVSVDDEPDNALLAARLSAVVYKRDVPGLRVVTVNFPDDMPLMECATTITISKGVWDNHTPGVHAESGAPTWVSSDNPALAALLAAHYECPVGAPSDLEATYHTENGPPDAGASGGMNSALTTTSTALSLMLAFVALARLAMLRVDAGRDFQSRVMADTASNGTASYAAANWIAVTETATAPAAGDTTLAGELSGSGFTRAQAVYAHSAGVASYTLSKTFTSADATTRTLQKIGVLNASTSGTLVFETAIPSPPALVSGDQVAITETVTI